MEKPPSRKGMDAAASLKEKRREAKRERDRIAQSKKRQATNDQIKNQYLENIDLQKDNTILSAENRALWEENRVLKDSDLKKSEDNERLRRLLSEAESKNLSSMQTLSGVLKEAVAAAAACKCGGYCPSNIARWTELMICTEDATNLGESHIMTQECREGSRYQNHAHITTSHQGTDSSMPSHHHQSRLGYWGDDDDDNRHNYV